MPSRVYKLGPLAVALAISACTGAGTPSSVAQSALAPSRAFADVRAAVGPDGQTVHHAAACGGGHRFQCKARIRTDADGYPLAAPFAGTSGYAPADLQAAYGLDPTRTPNATIAVVDAFGYPNAESDLASYRSTFNLPPCTVASGCLKIVDQTGGSNLPGAPPAGDDWTVETALDLDMASAACPNCKLLLVQATDDMGDGLNIGQKTAAMLGATVISDSWGDTAVGAAATMQEKYFDLSPYKSGIFIAAGDDGYDNYKLGTSKTGPDYPSTSEFVVAVGGTNLKKSSTTRGWSETAWTSGGSSCSDIMPIPSWQMGVTTGCKFRAACDVAAVGDPATGVAVFNADTSSSPFNVGGTSASSPFVAGVFALYGHGEVKGDFVYNNKSAWNDVTSGTNGTCGTVSCQAGAGWDGPTGWGTPNGKALAMIAPGDGNPPPDMAAQPDLATAPDLAAAPDLAEGGGNGGNGGGTGTGGNGGNGGNGGGSGCSLGGSAASGGLWLVLVAVAALLARSRRLRP